MSIDVENTLNRVLAVVANQRVGVLATTMDGKPYASLMAYDIKDDLSQIVLVTRRDTRKFREITSSPQVAFLWDTRSHTDTFFTATIVVTAEGIAVEAEASDYPALRTSFIKRQEQLTEFVNAADTVFLVITVTQYDVVTEFESVKTLYMNNSADEVCYTAELKANY